MPNPTNFTDVSSDKYRTNIALPEIDSFKEAQSNVLQSKYNDFGSMSQTGEEFAKSISYGESISDIINKTESLQDQTRSLINNYNPIVPKTAFSGGNSESDVYNKLYKSINPSTPTLKARNVPVNLGTQSEFERYARSSDFEQFGFTPNMGSEQEYKYGRAMGWGETIGKAIAGGSHLAADTFIEGWKGWGRMASALFTWDSSKLMGSEQERYQMAKEQEDIMNKYAIYDTETSQDSLLNRQFFGTMLQQAGFAVGAATQFVAEEFLTAGLASFLQPALKGAMLARGVKYITKAEDFVNSTRKVMGTVTKQERIVKSIADGAKRLVPMYGTATEFSKLYKAGAGYLQLGMTGLGGIKRALSEFNMARSESIYEAAGTYKQLTDKLISEYTQTNGKPPEGADLEKIKQTAEDASHDNFWTNVGVLSVMNRIQFDNMFKGFSKTRSILGDGVAELEGTAFSVTGKVAGKTQTKAFEKGMLGEFGAFGEVSKVFGKKTAAWEATKSLGKGLMKFEGSEGLQELIQNASSTGLQDYYYDLYHGKKGYTGELAATLENMQNPLTDMEGMKTFLMGALTGRLIAPMSFAFSKSSEKITDFRKKKADINYQSRAEKAKESIDMLNAFYANPSAFKKEWIASVKVNNKAAETMDEAARNHNRYVYYNHKDSAFAKTVAAAIKLDMFDSMRDTLKEYGNEMTDEEFKAAFGIEATADNKKNVKNLTGNIVTQMEDYHTIYHNLMDKYGDRVLPELYKNNDPEQYMNAIRSKMALGDAIELLATNTFRSRQAVIRASNLQTEISKNKNIGSSSIEVLTKLGSQEGIEDHIKILSSEIKNMESDISILSPEGKELLSEKKEELKLANRWKEAYLDLLDNTDESRSPATEGRAYEAFKDLVNLFNKRSKLKAVVSKEDIDDSFIKINDYIRLNEDNKSFVDAMNLLADPNNINLVTNKMYEAIGEMGETFKKEHKAEIKESIGTEDELDGEDLDELTKTLEVPEEGVEDPGLEAFLKEEYEKVKAALKDGQTIQDYESWKAGPGKFVAERYKKKQQNKKETKKKEETKKEEKPSTTKGHYKVNGRVVTMEGIPGTIDFTGALKGTDIKSMPEIAELIKNWDKDFIKQKLVNFNGQFVFNYSGRVCVLMEVGKFIVPYYFSSSGTSGKAIDWHYIFGINGDGNWIIKGGVDDKGEMVYNDKMKSTYPKAIAELEKIKNEIRTKLAMTSSQRDSLRDKLATKEMRDKYPVSLNNIYKGLDVVEAMTPDGVVTNENYHWLIANTLALTGLDAKEGPKPKQDPQAILVNGRAGRIRETNTASDGRKFIDIEYDVPEGVSLTEEEKANNSITLILDPKTKTVTDEKGNPVTLSKPGAVEETKGPTPPPPPTPDVVERESIKKYTVKKDDVTRSYYVVDQDGNVVIRNVKTKEAAEKYVKDITGVTDAEKADLQKRIDTLQKNINDKFPNGGIIQNGDSIDFSQEYMDMEAELEELKKQMKAFEQQSVEEKVRSLESQIKTLREFMAGADSNAAIESGERQIKELQRQIDELTKKPLSQLEIKRAEILKQKQAELKNLDDNLGVFDDDYTEKVAAIEQKYQKLLDALEENPEQAVEIEPEYEAGDYKKAYAIGRAIVQGKNVNTPENLQLLTNYPKLIEAAIKIEGERAEQLSENIDEKDVDLINAINDTYDQRAKDLIASGKPLPEEVEITSGNVPATAQMLTRNTAAQMLSDSKYASGEYQEGYRQLFPSTSLGNTTDLVKIDSSDGKIRPVRNGINPNYVFDVATREFPPGTQVKYRVMTADEDFDNMGPNRITGKRYEKSKIFDENGKVRKAMYYETPIQIIATIRGEERVIGHVREPLWIQHKIAGKYINISTPEGVDEKTHVENEMAENMKLRNKILDTFNKNSNFEITGHVRENGKSIGILKMTDTPGLLKDRVDPRIGEGGLKNEHGFFAIVRNGRLETAINVEAANIVDSPSFKENITRMSGVPALMLPTPTGTFMPTYIGLPKVDEGQAQFIIEAWKAFTGKTENPELVAAVYKSLNRKMSGSPSIGVLREYISQYITTLEHDDKLDRLGTGAAVPPGSARLNIFDDGNLGIEVKDDIEMKNGKKVNQWYNNGGRPIRKVEDLPENIITLLQNLRMTIKFNDRRNDDLVGINNKTKVNFLTMKDGKLVSKEMTYNEYVMEKATTFVEKGTESKNLNNDWVYFANPVVQLTLNEPTEIEPDVYTKEETPPPTIQEVEGPKEDKAAALLAAIKAKKLTEEQIEEKKEECLQTKINNIL